MVFAAETVVVLVLLTVVHRIRSSAAERPPKLDGVGVGLSALGLGLTVFAILKISTWGLFVPTGALDDRRHEDHPVWALGGAVHDLRGTGRARVASSAGRSGWSGKEARRCYGPTC